jgi:hypothetical protein
MFVQLEDSLVVEELRGRRVCSGLRLRRDTTLVTTAQTSATFFDLLSQMVGDGVCCCGLFVLFKVCSCGDDASVHYVQLLAFLKRQSSAAAILK